MKYRRRASVSTFSIFTFLLVATSTAAQGPAAVTDLRSVDSGSVVGVAKDASSAHIPGVTVTLTNSQTGTVLTRITDATGNYSFQAVPPGNYKLSADLPGFNPEVRNNIQIGASIQIRVDLVLQLGGGIGRPNAIVEGTRLVWTAVAGTGNTYVIERSGPGLTLFTPVAGPISETSYFVDTKGSDFDKGASYNYRVRTIDSAGNKAEPSNAVSVRSNRIADLPLVSSNVCDLVTISGQPVCPELNRTFTLENNRPDVTSVIFTGTKKKTLSFTSIDGSQTYSWGCPDCSIIVGPEGVGPATGNTRGVIFKLSANESTMQITCRAVKCEVFSAQRLEVNTSVLRASGDVVQRTLSADQTATIPATQRALLTVSDRQ